MGLADLLEMPEDILKFCDEMQVSAHPVMMTPLPGTELFEQYKPYLYKNYEWNTYDGNHAVFEHPTMDPVELEGHFVKLRSDLFSMDKILRRITKVGLRGFPYSHVFSWMLQYPQGKAFRKYARDWMLKHGKPSAD